MIQLSLKDYNQLHYQWMNHMALMERIENGEEDPSDHIYNLIARLTGMMEILMNNIEVK